MTPVEATLLIGAIAALIAIWGVLTQRQIARRRATLDHIARSEADNDVLAARRQFIEAAKAGGIAAWAEADKEKSEEAQKILLVLNEFELISIGIQRGILDYRIYRMWSKTATISYWNHATPFVAALRNRVGNEALFHEF